MAKRPRDPNQLAKLIVAIVPGEAEDATSAKKKSPTTKDRAGGLNCGKARATQLSPTDRADCACSRICQNSGMPSAYRVLRTWSGKKEFRYSGTVNSGVRIS